MQDSESFHTCGYEMHGLLASHPESPLERFLTPNWVEDANNLHARLNIGDMDVRWEGLSIPQARQAMAQAFVHQAMRNATRVPSSHATGNPEQEPPSDDETTRK